MGDARAGPLDFGRSTCCAGRERIALLIGNRSYTTEIASPYDIAFLEGVLKRLGFEVTTVRDAGLVSLHEAVNAHVRRDRQSGGDAISFFYYSGHWAADGATNYLIPGDVTKIKSALRVRSGLFSATSISRSNFWTVPAPRLQSLAV